MNSKQPISQSSGSYEFDLLIPQPDDRINSYLYPGHIKGMAQDALERLPKVTSQKRELSDVLVIREPLLITVIVRWYWAPSETDPITSDVPLCDTPSTVKDPPDNSAARRRFDEKHRLMARDNADFDFKFSADHIRALESFVDFYKTQYHDLEKLG